jgi:8-oxo-dGTP diphosphatase
LIIQRSADDEIEANIWECAGGNIDFGEDLEDGLIREIKEEVGLSVTVDKLLYAVTFKTNEHRQVIILSYSCTAHDNKVVLSDEHHERHL